jgi:ATP-dependent Clp protease adaptor protein ClpS
MTMNLYSESVDDCIDNELEDSPPSNWGVLFLNDDVTPIGLVVEILCEVFDKTPEDAESLAYGIHSTKKPGLAGMYRHEIALLKSRITEEVARRHGYPLKTELIEIA